MGSTDEAVRRALRAFQEDADEHPGHEVLEAYVDGRLTPEERDQIDRLAARSRIVAEDLADLRAIQKSLSAPPSRRLYWGAVAAAIAASLVAAIWLTNRPLPESLPPATHLTASEADYVHGVIDRGRIELGPQVLALMPEPGTLLGAATTSAFGPASPVGTFIRTARPVFNWSSTNADAFTVSVFDENFNEVASSGRITQTTWTAEADLPRDKRYAWQVTAHRGDENQTEPRPPRPEARFAILDDTRAALATRTIARLHDEPLALGIILVQQGLIADAREALERAAADPNTSQAARRLLESLDQGTPITTKPAQ